jgi:hypothetical protein
MFSILAAMLLAGTAEAQLSEVDLDPGSGDGKVTFDASSGLYWLDVTETLNLSVSDVLGGSGGWIAAGWRYATPTEICDLFANYALAVPICGGTGSGSTSGDVLASLQGFVGLTIDNGISRTSSAFYDDGGDPDRVGIGRLMYQVTPDISYSLVQSDATTNNPISSYGSWLVRDTPPPTPLPLLSFRISLLSGVMTALVLAAGAWLAGGFGGPRRAKLRAL